MGTTGIINMFTVELKRVDDRQARQVCLVSADTLVEAERFVTGLLQVQYDTRCVWLIHTDDLVYHVYTESGFVGVVQIRLEG